MRRLEDEGHGLAGVGRAGRTKRRSGRGCSMSLLRGTRSVATSERAGSRVRPGGCVVGELAVNGAAEGDVAVETSAVWRSSSSTSSVGMRWRLASGPARGRRRGSAAAPRGRGCRCRPERGNGCRRSIPAMTICRSAGDVKVERMRRLEGLAMKVGGGGEKLKPSALGTPVMCAVTLVSPRQPRSCATSMRVTWPSGAPRHSACRLRGSSFAEEARCTLPLTCTCPVSAMERLMSVRMGWAEKRSCHSSGFSSHIETSAFRKEKGSFSRHA